VKLRKRYLSVAAVLGAAVAIVPALAGATAPSEAKLEVNQNCEVSTWACWTTEGSASIAKPTKSVTIASGGTITFIDHASTAAAVVWMGSAPACTGVPTSAMTNWEGKCTFATPGTYNFESSTLFNDGVDNYTKYEVVVEGSTTTTGTTGTTTTPTMTTTSPSSPESPLAGSESQAVKVAKSQRGGSVKGSLQISKAGGGDRLEVDLLATTASLAKAGHTTQVVGRFVSASVSAGHRSFSVKLNAKARRALKRHHRLALKVKITLTPVNGEATSVTRSVTLHS
jgi:plastocyanin